MEKPEDHSSTRSNALSSRYADMLAKSKAAREEPGYMPEFPPSKLIDDSPEAGARAAEYLSKILPRNTPSGGQEAGISRGKIYHSKMEEFFQNLPEERLAESVNDFSGFHKTGILCNGQARVLIKEVQELTGASQPDAFQLVRTNCLNIAAFKWASLMGLDRKATAGPKPR